MTVPTLSHRTDRLSSERPSERVLPGVPAARLSTAELTAECHRRGLVVLDGQQPRVLPGLIVHAGGRVIHWRGAEHTLTGIEGRVMIALAGLWPRPIVGRALALAVWGPDADENNARVAVQNVRRRCPGLIETLGYSGYRLNLGAES